MHLRVVAQGLKMAHTLHGVGNGLLVQDAPGVQLDVHIEALLHQAFQYLRLHLAHQLHADLRKLLVPANVELRVLLAQLLHLGQHQRRVTALGQDHPVAEHRLQYRRRGVCLRSQALSGPAAAEPQHGADLPRHDAVHRLIFHPGVEPDLAHLFLQHIPLLIPVADGAAHLQLPAGDLHVGQALALGVPGDLVHPGGKVPAVVLLRDQPIQRPEKVLHALGFQPGAEEAGEQPPPCDERADGLPADPSLRQVFLHGLLVAEGDLLIQLPLRQGKVQAGRAQPLLQLRHQLLPAGVGQIHLGDEEETGQIVALHQPPQSLRMGLHAACSADHQHRLIQHLHAALRLSGKVHMARRVQQRHRMPLQPDLGLLGENGDAPLPLQTVGVQKAVPVIHPAQLFNFSRKVQHGLAEGGLPRVHMGHNAKYRMILIKHEVYFNRKPMQNQLLYGFPRLINIICNLLAKIF